MKQIWDLSFEVKRDFNLLADAYKKEHKIGKNSQLQLNIIIPDFNYLIGHSFASEFIREICKVSKVEILIDETLKEHKLEVTKALGVECSRCEMFHDGNGYDFGYVEEFCSDKKKDTKLCIKCIDVLKDYPDHWSYPYLRQIEKDKGWI